MVESLQLAIATSLPFYRDRNGVKRRTPLPTNFALTSALGSPSSSLDTNPGIALPKSPRCQACSTSASESRYRSSAMQSDLVLAEVDLVLQGSGVLAPHDLH